ncbi:surface-adhesin E family protein [Achromobacter marplatensis]|uniref:surface-adhesin E family protein n=1 Tax=Achromobacter marplatensis TaxID=470868 RepID=UPI0039F73942
MIARHARFALALALSGVASWMPSALAAPPDVCQAVTVREGDPIPPDACAVDIVPRDLDVSRIAFGDGPAWTPLDPRAMPGVFYDSSSIAPVSEKPVVMAVTVAWFYAQPRVSETNGQPYGSVSQPVLLNCGANTYTVTETRHYAGNDATGALVESIPVAGIHDAPVARDPVQRKLRAMVCPPPGKTVRK